MTELPPRSLAVGPVLPGVAAPPPPGRRDAPPPPRRPGLGAALTALGLLALFAPPFLFPDNVFRLGLLAKFMALAVLALGVDLIWGYAGMLSLGQGLYFGLGAYAVAYSLELQQAAAEAG